MQLIAAKVNDILSVWSESVAAKSCEIVWNMIWMAMPLNSHDDVVSLRNQEEAARESAVQPVALLVGVNMTMLSSSIFFVQLH